jgi:hypothetical protein
MAFQEGEGAKRTATPGIRQPIENAGQAFCHHGGELEAGRKKAAHWLQYFLFFPIK